MAENYNNSSLFDRLDRVLSDSGVVRGAWNNGRRKTSPEEQKKTEEHRKAFQETILPEIRQEFSDRFYYIQFPDIVKSSGMTDTLWQEGKKIASTPGQCWIRSLDEYISVQGQRGWYIQGVMMDRSGYSFSVEAYFTARELRRISCGLWRCREHQPEDNQVFCAHEAALLVMLEKLILEKNPGDPTDETASRLIQNLFRKNRLESTEGEGQEEQKRKKESLHIVPTLKPGREGRLFLSFQYGTSRMYKIRSIPTFVRTMESSGVMKAGKTSIQIDQSLLDRKSEQFYQMMREGVMASDYESEKASERVGYPVRVPGMKGDLPLYGRTMDRFVEMMEDSGILCDDGNSKKMLRVEEKAPEISLQIRRNRNSGEDYPEIELEGQVPELVRGEQYGYYLQDDILYRIPAEWMQKMQPILQAATGGRLRAVIGPEYLSAFYYDVLPWIEENCRVDVEEGTFPEDMVPEEAVFTFDLDMDDEKIHCRASVSYGEEKFLLTKSGQKAELRSDRHPWMVRNLPKEEEISETVLKYFPEQDEKEFYAENTEKNAFRIVSGGLEELERIGTVRCTERFQKTKIRRSPAASVGVSVSGGLLHLSVTSSDLTPEELAEVLKNYDPKKRYHRLSSGDFIDISSGSIPALAEMMRTMHLTPKELVSDHLQVPEYRAFYLDSMLSGREDLYEHRDRNFRKIVRNLREVEDAEYEIPEKLEPVLRNYQKTGFEWVMTLYHYGFGGILADEMGLGKTLQMITVMEALKKESAHTLIVAPAALIYNWGEEIVRFSDSLEFLLVTGTQKERKGLIERWNTVDVLITSYDLLKRDISLYEGKTFDLEILDEAQNIRNSTTAAAKSVKLISAKGRFALTGTPIENRLSELWSIFDFLMPGFLYNYPTFRKLFETPVVRQQDAEASAQLTKMISPFVLRRLKKDVLKELPPKTEEVYYASLEGEQKKLYNAEVLKLTKMVQGTSRQEFAKKKIEVLSQLTRIREVCCDPSLYLENYKGESTKRDACLQLLKDAVDGGHKVLVFSQFTSMMDLLEQDAEAAGISFFEIRGSTPKQKRMRLVKEFNQDDTSVFFISLKAGGTGLNLTGADIVIHYDPWWNAAAENQATDRAHRIGQKHVVTVYKLIMKSTVEEKILKLQRTKADLADEVLSGADIQDGKLTQEELLEILQG